MLHPVPFAISHAATSSAAIFAKLSACASPKATGTFIYIQCNMLPEKHPAGPPTYMPPEIHTASAALPLARNGCGCALRRQTETSRGCGILGPKSYLDEQSVHVSIETAVAEQSSLMALREVEVILACTCLHLVR
jgi:hypothetical protein